MVYLKKGACGSVVMWNRLVCALQDVVYGFSDVSQNRLSADWNKWRCWQPFKKRVLPQPQGSCPTWIVFGQLQV